MIIRGREPLLKRLPVVFDPSEEIQKYDTDNRYPQRAKETMFRSYTLNGIVEKLSGFTNGEGFVDPINKLVINEDGQTLRELLDLICYDYSWANGFALHVQYNLNFTIASLRHIPFEFCRLGLPDKDGCVDDIAYCTNWEQDYMKEMKNRNIIYYDLFDPIEAQEEIMEYGIENFKGQIFYFTPQKYQYPKATFDSVFEHAQTQAEIAVYALANVVNGFTAGHIFLYPGKFETDQEAYDFKKKMQDHKGAMGANSMMVIEAGTGDIKGDNLLIKTEQQNNDKLFEFTLNWIEKAMLQCFGMPPEIIGKLPDTGMFNKQQIEDSYIYFNAVTRDRRNRVSTELKKLFAYWNTPIQSNFDIKPQVYDLAGAAAQPVTATNVTLTNMTGRQNQNYKRMLREYESGKANWKTTKLNLQSAFGFSDDEILTLIGDNPDGQITN